MPVPVVVALLAATTAAAQSAPEAATPVEVAPAEAPTEPAPPATPAPAALDPAVLDQLIERRSTASPTRPRAGTMASSSSPRTARASCASADIQYDGRHFFNDTDRSARRSIRVSQHPTRACRHAVRPLGFSPPARLRGRKLVIQEAYGDIRYSPAFEIRFGKFKVPFGLERLQAEVSTR